MDDCCAGAQDGLTITKIGQAENHEITYSCPKDISKKL